MADSRFLYLLDKFPQEVPEYAPWPRISALSDAELEADLAIAAELSKLYPASTPEGAIGGGIIRGWLAQALGMRPQLLDYPAGLV